MSVILSRYLYILDEVKYCFKIAIIHRKPLKESIFWFSEYYRSGYEEECWQLIFKIYYEYFACINYYFEKVLIRTYETWKKDNDIYHLIYIIQNFHLMEINKALVNVKDIEKNKDKKLTLLRGKIPDRFKNITNKECQKLIRFLEKGNIQMIYHIYKNSFYEIDIDIINDFYKCNLKLNNDYYNEKDEIKLSQIFLALNNEKNLNKQKIFVKPSNEIIKFERELNNIENIKNYNILKEKRLYRIYDELIYYELERNKMDFSKLKKDILLKWEVYAYECRLWKQRIKEYGGYIENNEIYFKDNDELERFYEKYGFELDEQSKDVQDKSLINIKKINI